MVCNLLFFSLSENIEENEVIFRFDFRWIFQGDELRIGFSHCFFMLHSIFIHILVPVVPVSLDLISILEIHPL